MNAEGLRRYREDVLAMSQAELAAVFGVRQQTISEWETGKRAIRLGAIVALALERLGELRRGEGEHGVAEGEPAGASESAGEGAAKGEA